MPLPNNPPNQPAQISRWFVVLASSGGAGDLPGDWSGVGMGGGGIGGDGGGGAGVAAVMVKRALLADITRLCVFFGFENTLDSILPQLITFLNDRCARCLHDVCMPACPHACMPGWRLGLPALSWEYRIIRRREARLLLLEVFLWVDSAVFVVKVRGWQV